MTFIYFLWLQADSCPHYGQPCSTTGLFIWPPDVSPTTVLNVYRSQWRFVFGSPGEELFAPLPHNLSRPLCSHSVQACAVSARTSRYRQTLVLLQHATNLPTFPRCEKKTDLESKLRRDSYYCERYCRRAVVCSIQIDVFLIIEVCQHGLACRYRRHFPPLPLSLLSEAAGVTPALLQHAELCMQIEVCMWFFPFLHIGRIKGICC